MEVLQSEIKLRRSRTHSPQPAHDFASFRTAALPRFTHSAFLLALQPEFRTKTAETTPFMRTWRRLREMYSVPDASDDLQHFDPHFARGAAWEVLFDFVSCGLASCGKCTLRAVAEMAPIDAVHAGASDGCTRADEGGYTRTKSSISTNTIIEERTNEMACLSTV